MPPPPPPPPHPPPYRSHHIPPPPAASPTGAASAAAAAAAAAAASAPQPPTPAAPGPSQPGSSSAPRRHSTDMEASRNGATANHSRNANDSNTNHNNSNTDAGNSHHTPTKARDNTSNHLRHAAVARSPQSNHHSSVTGPATPTHTHHSVGAHASTSAGISQGGTGGGSHSRPSPPTPSTGGHESTRGRSLTYADLARCFHLPINSAARELGICVTALKKQCRRHGVPRWPHRKLRSLDKLKEKLEKEEANATDKEYYKVEIENIAQKKGHIFRTGPVVRASAASVTAAAAAAASSSVVAATVAAATAAAAELPHGAHPLHPITHQHSHQHSHRHQHQHQHQHQHSHHHHQQQQQQQQQAQHAAQHPHRGPAGPPQSAVSAPLGHPARNALPGPSSSSASGATVETKHGRAVSHAAAARVAVDGSPSLQRPPYARPSGPPGDPAAAAAAAAVAAAAATAAPSPVPASMLVPMARAPPQPGMSALVATPQFFCGFYGCDCLFNGGISSQNFHHPIPLRPPPPPPPHPSAHPPTHPPGAQQPPHPPGTTSTPQQPPPPQPPQPGTPVLGQAGAHGMHPGTPAPAGTAGLGPTAAQPHAPPPPFYAVPPQYAYPAALPYHAAPQPPFHNMVQVNVVEPQGYAQHPAPAQPVVSQPAPAAPPQGPHVSSQAMMSPIPPPSAPSPHGPPPNHVPHTAGMPAASAPQPAAVSATAGGAAQPQPYDAYSSTSQAAAAAAGTGAPPAPSQPANGYHYPGFAAAPQVDSVVQSPTLQPPPQRVAYWADLPHGANSNLVTMYNQTTHYHHHHSNLDQPNSVARSTRETAQSGAVQPVENGDGTVSSATNNTSSAPPSAGGALVASAANAPKNTAPDHAAPVAGPSKAIASQKADSASTAAPAAASAAAKAAAVLAAAASASDRENGTPLSGKKRPRSTDADADDDDDDDDDDDIGEDEIGDDDDEMRDEDDDTPTTPRGHGPRTNGHVSPAKHASNLKKRLRTLDKHMTSAEPAQPRVNQNTMAGALGVYMAGESAAAASSVTPNGTVGNGADSGTGRGPCGSGEKACANGTEPGSVSRTARAVAKRPRNGISHSTDAPPATDKAEKAGSRWERGFLTQAANGSPPQEEEANGIREITPPSDREQTPELRNERGAGGADADNGSGSGSADNGSGSGSGGATAEREGSGDGSGSGDGTGSGSGTGSGDGSGDGTGSGESDELVKPRGRRMNSSSVDPPSPSMRNRLNSGRRREWAHVNGHARVGRTQTAGPGAAPNGAGGSAKKPDGVKKVSAGVGATTNGNGPEGGAGGVGREGSTANGVGSGGATTSKRPDCEGTVSCCSALHRLETIVHGFASMRVALWAIDGGLKVSLMVGPKALLAMAGVTVVGRHAVDDADNAECVDSLDEMRSIYERAEDGHRVSWTTTKGRSRFQFVVAPMSRDLAGSYGRLCGLVVETDSVVNGTSHGSG